MSQEERHLLKPALAWGLRRSGDGEEMQPWGEPATQPSLSPLTELNELSILSVLEENSWERPGGGGWGRRDKGKDLAPTWTWTWTAPRLRCSSALLLH